MTQLHVLLEYARLGVQTLVMGYNSPTAKRLKADDAMTGGFLWIIKADLTPI